MKKENPFINLIKLTFLLITVAYVIVGIATK